MINYSHLYEATFEFPHTMMKILGFTAIRDDAPKRAKAAHNFYRTWSHAFFFFFMCCSCYYLYQVRKDIVQAMTTLTGSVGAVGVFAKSLVLRVKAKRIRTLQTTLNFTLSTEVRFQDRLVYEKSAHEMRMHLRIVYKLISMLLAMWVASGIISSLSTDLKNFPLPVYIPWDIQWTPVYVFSCIYQTYGAFLIGLNGVTINLIIIGSVAQVCTEFEILERKIDFIVNEYDRKNPERGLLNKEENSAVRDLIITVIQHHQKIIDCVNEIESFYIHIFLFQFILTGSLGTLLSVEIILVLKTIDSSILVPVIFFCLLCVEIFLFCWFGTRLKNKSFDFAKAVYSLPWDIMNSENRTLMRIILLKAQRPSKLTIEKLSDIDFVSFLELSKIVYNIVYMVVQLSKNHKLDLEYENT